MSELLKILRALREHTPEAIECLTAEIALRGGVLASILLVAAALFAYVGTRLTKGADIDKNPGRCVGTIFVFVAAAVCFGSSLQFIGEALAPGVKLLSLLR